MAYTPPSGAVEFAFGGVEYVAPVGSVEVSWVPPAITGTLAVEVLPSAEALGSFFEVITGWCEAGVEVTFDVQGYAYPIGTFEWVVSVVAEFIGDHPPIGALQAEVSIAVEFYGTALVTGEMAFPLPLSVEFSASHFQPSVVDVSATFIGAVAELGTLAVEISPASVFVGGRGASGQMAVNVTLSATILGAAGSAGSLNVEVPVATQISGVFWEPYVGELSVEVPWLAQLHGEIHIEQLTPGITVRRREWIAHVLA